RERRLLPGRGAGAEPARPVASVPYQPRMAHRSELRAGADVPARCSERRAGDHRAPPGGSRPVLGAALLSMTLALLIANPAAGRTAAIDLGTVERPDGTHYFAVCSGTGFDARLMARTGAAEKRRWKMAAYVMRAFATLPDVTSPLHRVTVDGVAHELPAAMVL